MIDQLTFPDDAGLEVGTWYPIFFQANFDTPERLVAGVLANVNGKWHLQSASALERLKCLYGTDALVAIDAIETGLSDLEDRLGRPTDPIATELTVSGLSIGEPRKAEARNAAELARRWLRLTSSLHDRRKEVVQAVELASYQPASAEMTIARDISRDRLSVLVMERMTERFPQARKMFHQHVHKLEANQSARLLTHHAYVAYDGKRVAANFSTLKAGRNKPSVDVAKRLMWDLEQHRDQPDGLYEKQDHAMYLYHPALDDPTITERQYANVMEVVETLSEEGQNRGISVISRDSVAEISDALLEADGLA